MGDRLDLAKWVHEHEHRLPGSGEHADRTAGRTGGSPTAIPSEPAAPVRPRAVSRPAPATSQASSVTRVLSAPPGRVLRRRRGGCRRGGSVCRLICEQIDRPGTDGAPDRQRGRLVRARTPQARRYGRGVPGDWGEIPKRSSTARLNESVRTRGRAPGAAVGAPWADLDGASECLERGGERSASSACSSSSGSPRATSSPGLSLATRLPRRRRRRPPCGRGRRRGARRRRPRRGRRASRRSPARRGHELPLGRLRQRDRRSPPWAGPSPPTSPSPARRQHAGGSASSSPTRPSIAPARATVTSTTSGGPPPLSTSIDSSTSRALPARRPSGTAMSVSSATVRTPLASPSPTITSASSRRGATSGRKRPSPTFTSSTSAPVPSAIFFDMIELAISGIASTVAVTSRRA